ncbi:MAG: imidazole glycerol phosphate synthase subunit HisH [Alphaproteobacteria bacterium]|nr:imidazole glycerol phosphate synthase subunit HisH [Alphaproteobacteria bacterium]
MTIAIIDYGAGNLRSVARALEAAGASDIRIGDDPDMVASADRLVLPGQGAFKQCMGGLRARPGLIQAMTEAVHSRGRPFLGVCVGLQLLASRGLEHGETEGLGWIGGDCAPLPQAPGVRIPHMGWNEVRVLSDHPILADLAPARHLYFAHSFALFPADPAHILAETVHGIAFPVAAGRDNIVGVQFHPEKSQAIGLALLSAFLNWAP